MKMTGCPRETSAAVPQEPNLSDVLNDPIVVAVIGLTVSARTSWPGFSRSSSAARSLVQLARTEERKRDEGMFFTDD